MPRSKKDEPPVKNEIEKPVSELAHHASVVVSTEVKPGKKSAKYFGKIPKPIVLGTLLLVLLAGGWIAYSKLAPHNIKIGNTVITKADINNYGDELTSYSNSQKVNFGGSSQKVAQDDLILNAALKDQATKYHVTVTQSYIDSTLSAKYKSFGSKDSYDYFVKSKNIGYITKIRNENTAYEAKLEDHVIGKRSYFIVGITYDSPYFNNTKDPASLWAQATQTMNTKFLPLFKAGESEDQIAAQADFNTTVPNKNASSDISIFFNSAHTVAFNMNDCTISGACFNDISPGGSFKKIPGIESTRNKVKQLTKVGQYTDVFASEAGWIGIAQLKSQTLGSYESWDQLTQTYKKKYAPQITRLDAVQNHIALAEQGVSRHIDSVVRKIGITLAPKAYAARIICQGFAPGDNLTKHYANIAIRARDNVTGAFIGGIAITESRPVGGCPNKLGNYVDDADSPNSGSTQNGVAWTSSSGNQYNLIFYDNCWNQPPVMTVGSPPAGYTFMTDGSSFLSSPGVIDQITSNPPNSSLNSDLISQWIGHAGSVNAGDGESIDLEYQPTLPRWKLDPTSTVDTSTATSSTTATFTHTVLNKGPNAADYDWWIQGSYNGSAWTENACGSTNNGVFSCPLASGSPSGAAKNAKIPDAHIQRYKFPAGAKTGDTYCERIWDTNFNGPGTAGAASQNGNGQGICVKFTLDICPNIPGNQATIPAGRIKDAAGNCVIPPDSCPNIPGIQAAIPAGMIKDAAGNCVSLPTCNGGGIACHVRCDVNVTGALPGGYIQAGQPYTVTVTITNTGPSYGDSTYSLPATINIGGVDYGMRFTNYAGDYGGYPFDVPFSSNAGVPIAPGGSATDTFSLTAPGGNPSATSLVGAVEYKGSFTGNGADPNENGICSTTVNSYAPFVLTPYACKPQTGAAEDIPAGGLPYETAVGSSLSGYPVTAHTDSSFTLNGAAAVPGSGLDANYTSVNNASCGNSAQQAWAGTYPKPPSNTINAGDKFCSGIILNGGAWNAGWRGPGAANDIVDVSISAGVPVSASGCTTIVNEPYIHAFGSDVFAGGGFGDSCATSSGGINTYLSTTGLRPVGSGVQIGALAINPINGFSSAILRGSTPNGSTDLSFGNNGAMGSGSGAPALGGSLGGTFCSPNYFDSALPAGTPAKAVASDSLNLPSQGSAVNDTEYYPAGGTLPITGGSIGDKNNIAIFVKGNVHITGNISYANAVAGWGSLESIPSFQLFVEGNIYIDPGVTQLDGLYVAQPVNGAAAGTTGNIYTCSNLTGTAGLDTSNDLLSSCRSPLVVNGAFVAQKVFLNRSYGSLRNSAAGESLQYGTGKDCGAGNVASILDDCSAEIFNFSPELYIAQPATRSQTGPTTGKYDYFTSLSPVL